jgi:hypothetical protein
MGFLGQNVLNGQAFEYIAFLNWPGLSEKGNIVYHLNIPITGRLCQAQT